MKRKYWCVSFQTSQKYKNLTIFLSQKSDLPIWASQVYMYGQFAQIIILITCPGQALMSNPELNSVRTD